MVGWSHIFIDEAEELAHCVVAFWLEQGSTRTREHCRSPLFLQQTSRCRTSIRIHVTRGCCDRSRESHAYINFEIEEAQHFLALCYKFDKRACLRPAKRSISLFSFETEKQSKARGSSPTISKLGYYSWLRVYWIINSRQLERFWHMNWTW